MSQRRFYLACYDVTDDKRLREALKLVRPHAVGGQKSAHEVMLNEKEKRSLLEDLGYLLDLDEDRFLLISLDPRSRISTLGIAVPPLAEDFFYVG
ncbi:MAG TPA: CRISPR-associated endonuclease Cas2 [Gammaproteobacteria bacterium]|nr:CRISPR-associated endonuclease Cas2 [Gammaproteobacteria bacterium]